MPIAVERPYESSAATREHAGASLSQPPASSRLLDVPFTTTAEGVVVKWTPPTAGALQEAGVRLGLDLTDAQAAAYAGLAAGVAPAHERAAAVWAEHSEAATGRREPVWRPGSDPWHAVEYELLDDLPELAEDGPLAGLTLAVKSTIPIAGVPVGAGSPLVAGHVPAQSATAVTRALASGARITHTGRADDLCLALSGTTPHTGPVRNPWSAKHATWGSSAGAAALVAGGTVDAAVLVDQAGSGRAPAAGCGLVALMPTRGLIPTTGAFGFTPAQDRIAIASLSTRTVAEVAAALTGPDGTDLLCGPWDDHTSRALFTVRPEEVHGLRVGVVVDSLAPEHCDPAVADAVTQRAADLETLGAHVTTVSVPDYADMAALALLLTIYTGVPATLANNLGYAPAVLHGDPELAAQVAQRRAARPQDLAETMQLCATIAAADTAPPGWWAALAHGLIPRQRAAYLRALTSVDVLLTPTVPSTPPPLPAPDASLTDRLTLALSGITHTCHNPTGLPALQVPAARPGGLPVGAQLIAHPGREHRLLCAAAAIEDHDGGFPTAPGTGDRASGNAS